MVKARWANATALPDRKIRWANASAAGAGGALKVRWAKASAAGGAPLALRPIPDVSSEALASVTVTALVGATSPTPTGYVWRCISDPTLPFQDNGSSITFTTPAAYNGVTVVFGVVATLGAQSSSEATATINTIPHQYFLAGTTSWIPLTRTAVA